MRKLIIALVLGFGCTAFAQQPTTPQPPTKAEMEKMKKMTPEERQQKHLEHLTKELNLDAKQQEQVAKIMADKSAEMQKLKAEKEMQKGDMENRSKEDKMAMRDKMQAQKAETDAQMKAVLSAEQYEKWKGMQKQNKEKAKEYRKTQKGMY